MKAHELESFKDYENTSSRETVLDKFSDVSHEIGALARRTIELRPPEDGDAVVVFTGLDERVRLEAAVKLWSTGAFRHLLIGGSNPKEQGYESEEEVRAHIATYYDGTRDKDVYILPEARHTKDQADWLASTTDELGTRRLVVVDPDYHTPRVYATTVASMNVKGNLVPMWTSPIDYPADFVTPHPRYTGVRQTPVFMAGEDAKRIPIYQQTGDVASNEAWERHLDFTEKKTTS